jgi:hypothetical protein
VIAAYLSAQSGFLTGWQVKVGNEPDAPDNVVTVFDTGGVREDRSMAGAELVHPTVQVRVRAADYATGWRKGRAVEEALALVRNTAVTVGTPPESVVLKAAHRYIPLVSIGQDPNQNRRQVFVTNFKLTF